MKFHFVKTFYKLLEKAYSLKLKYQYRQGINRRIKSCKFHLSPVQKNQIKSFYLGYGIRRVNTKWHRFFTGSNATFSAQYIPEDLFHGVISNRLNQMRQWPSLLDKNLLNLFFNNIKQPEVILKNMNGFWFKKGEFVKKENALEALLDEPRDLIIKPSIESGSGQNIRILRNPSELKNQNEEILINTIEHYNKDFIIQELVKQHETLQTLNPDSLNTIRVLSYLNTNGVYILSAILRVGQLGSYIDNFESGGLVCGIKEDGRLKDFGFYDNGKKSYCTANGESLKNIIVPSFELVVDKVKEMHKIIPYFRLVSWDIGIDINSNPILIEYNTYHQNILAHQLTNGPLFGKFTDEILKEGLH